jgi:hypothetical protein
MSDASSDARPVRKVSEREIAIACVIELATQPPYKFSLLGFYDDDEDYLTALAERLGVPKPGTPGGNAFKNKLTKVVRRLVRFGVLRSQMSGTAKEYFGEPAKQMNYYLDPGRARRMRPGAKGYNGPEWEAEFLLRNAYPRPNLSNTRVDL